MWLWLKNFHLSTELPDKGGNLEASQSAEEKPQYGYNYPATRQQ